YSKGTVVFNSTATLASLHYTGFQGELMLLAWTGSSSSCLDALKFRHGLEAENKKYLALQTQLSFLFETGNILPPFMASSDDGADQESDENDKGDKEIQIIRSSCICLTF
ncbi:hypothetical protein EJD97_021325, partial [Solanum chilense]